MKKEIQGNETFTFDQFMQILLEVTKRKFKKSQDVDTYLIHLIESHIKPYYRYALVKDDMLDHLIKPSVLQCFHRHSKHLKEVRFRFYFMLKRPVVYILFIITA
jgi:hypothetical protein